MDLKESLDASPLEFTKVQTELAADFLNQVFKWNKTRNLISRKLTKKDLAEHFIDCALLNQHTKNGSILDVGSGAGFPGICLAIMSPEKDITLVDSNIKKTSFLLHVKNALGLKYVLVENKRLESIKKIEEAYLVCRAFMAPRLFAETVKDKISKDTKVIVMISEEERFSLDGFKTRFIKSEATEFFNKKRGFLEFQKT